MPAMTEAQEAMIERYYAKVEELSAVAFAAGCRLAMTMPELVTDPRTMQMSYQWQHVMLLPGESPPAGPFRKWTIYEQRNGMGRSI